ncbi:sulfate ABC transporter ATP-binding protein [Spirochaetia bacterium]|nr:sulfate ABC transporter ATP-binding protein [Spirochaetia bacterium]
MSIQIDHISKKFGDFTALDNVQLNIPEGQITALLGPSGSGKTTLLRIIAGLETADSGAVIFFGVDTTNKQIRDRGVGFVFQHYALFKHMSVFDNVAFGLNIRPRKTRPSKAEIKERVLRLLSMVQLQSMANRLPQELSGGQKQRVALARALAVEPKVLLLDEPFGALDAKVRQELRRSLRRLNDELRVTSVFVTHDQEEALEVSDSIVILNKGRIEQSGTPDDVYDNPANPFVYGFLGNVNLFHARLKKGAIDLNKSEDAPKDDGDVKFFVRPQDITLSPSDDTGRGIKAKIISYRLLGSRVRVELKTLEGERNIEADVSKSEWAIIKKAEVDFVYLRFESARIYSSDEQWSDYTI